ncbi:MAG: gluconate 2-dehydrogenase subunit 3 family protein [Anaerolineae bacterium]|nr:gluconate 2-dehydrogenase subunit 3 family protein [Gemmatimonadaceae bacterium]
MPPMNRREAVKTTTAFLGGVLLTSNGLLVACARDTSNASGKILTVDDQSLIEEIADTLLPTTPASPGAKAAGAGAAINLLLTDCYEPDVQERVVNGLTEFRRTCDKRTGSSFASLPKNDREELLREIDLQAQKAGDAHYFGLVRELALRAYFSSEIGKTKALRFVLVPGKWVGCVPLSPGQPAWG